MRQWWKALLLLLVCIAYPLSLHMLIRNDAASGLQLVLVALPFLLFAGWLLWRMAGRAWRPLVVVAFLALVVFMARGQHERIGLIAVNGVTHAALNLFLLWFFGRTLLPGKEPLITQISRRVNGDVQPDIALYTRRVTLVWCIYFAAQIMVSLLLYLFAPLSAWSLFVNVLNLPLLVLMFAGEYVWRITHYPHHARTSIRKAFEVYAKDFAGSQKH